MSDAGFSQTTSTSFSLRFLAQRNFMAWTAFLRGDVGSSDRKNLTFSRLIPSSQLSGWPLIMHDPLPWAMTLRIKTFRIEPAGGSFSRACESTSLRRLMLKWIGAPSPHQNQPFRLHSMTPLEGATSLTSPPAQTQEETPHT